MSALPTAILIGCLNGLQWLLWLTAGLLIVLVVVQALRGDADSRPMETLFIAMFMFGGGIISGLVARRLLRR